MTRAAVAVGILLLMLVACSKNQPVKQDREPKLKALLATTDKLLIKDFYETQSVSPPVPPPSVGAYHITTSWVPGHISFEPIIVSEPAGEQGKEPSRLKGLRVEVQSKTYKVDTTKGKQEESAAFLDDDEARDFDTALTYLAGIAGEWQKQKPDHYREVMFQSKDSFVATLFIADEGPVILVKSGTLGAAMLTIPSAQFGEVQSKLRAALKSLDTH